MSTQKYLYPRRKYANIIVAIYIIVTLLLSPALYSVFAEVMTYPQPRTWQKDMGILLSSNFRITEATTDIDIYGTFYYPNGILVVDEIVNVSAKVVLHTPEAQSIRGIVFGFQMGEDPAKKGENGIRESAQMNFDMGDSFIEGSDVVMKNNTQVVWSTEGDFVPILYIINGTGYAREFNTNDLIFHVYPRAELINMDSNKTSILLTIALFIFTVVGVVTLYFDLRDFKVRNPNYKPTEQPKQLKKETDAKIEPSKKSTINNDA
jgi:hypothetical protein